MYIIPAIDLIGGKAVRLQKGDYNKVTVYSDTPVDVAKGFEAVGARLLHVVDLDGAKDGTTANFDTVKAIIEQTGLSGTGAHRVSAAGHAAGDKNQPPGNLDRTFYQRYSGGSLLFQHHPL